VLSPCDWEVNFGRRTEFESSSLPADKQTKCFFLRKEERYTEPRLAAIYSNASYSCNHKEEYNSTS
jgi:hypothetical protein